MTSVEYRDKLRKKDKVAIVGFADSWNEAPYEDETWEVWGLNSLFEIIPRWDLWFEIHERKAYKMDTNKEIGYGLTRTGQPYMEALAQLKCKDKPTPIFMCENYPDIPNSMRYPLEEIIMKFDPSCKMKEWDSYKHIDPKYDWNGYFNNSISYMIALAIDWGYPEIGIWGVDMATACTAPDVRILREDLRWVRADSLKVGDGVIGFDEMSSDNDGHSRRWRKSVVTSCNKLNKPCYRLKLEDDTEMIVSAKHGWLTHAENENRWRKQENLITRHHRQDRPTKIVKVLDTWESEPSWEAGYLAGAFNGEGHISQRPRKQRYDYEVSTHGINVGFAQKENVMSEQVENILNYYGFDIRANKENGGTKKYRINGGKPEIIRFLGSIRPPRLIEKFDAGLLGQFMSKENVPVVESEFIGNHEVIGLETESKTFIAEGFASHNSEYGSQRPSCEYYIGIAVGKGIKITLPNTSDLLKVRNLYGIEDEKRNVFVDKVNKLIGSMAQRRGQAMQQFEMARKQVDQYIGAEECAKEIMKIWGP